MKTTELGFTPEFEQFIVTRAAELMKLGSTSHEAIEQAMRDGMAWLTELAQDRTPKAKAVNAAIIRGMYIAARGSVPEGRCLGTPRCHGINPREHVPACPLYTHDQMSDEAQS